MFGWDILITLLNSFKLIDFCIFVLTFADEYNKCYSEGQKDVIDCVLSRKMFNNKIFDLQSCSHSVSLEDIRSEILNLLFFFCEKQTLIPFLTNAYTFGCTALIYENEECQSFSCVKELREILSKRKASIEVKKETVLEKLIKNNSESNDVAGIINNLVIFSEDNQKNIAKYPKVLTTVPRRTLANIFLFLF